MSNSNESKYAACAVARLCTCTRLAHNGTATPSLNSHFTIVVYTSAPDVPVKEIMKDMMETSKGVQHHTRDLFLLHYLSGQTRNHLPFGDDDG